MEPDIRALIDMLCSRRPAWSKSERRFIRKWLSPLGMEIDDFGNLSKRIGRAPVLWSCHTDSVHRQGGFQKIKIATSKAGISTVMLHESADSNCLGADDAAGIWLMREMILARVPGLYIFHRAEEIGGLGSSYIAKETPNALYGILYAIALDRRGIDSVITHQGYGRCCSQNFAKALAKAIGSKFYPDNTGTFTDTANYVDIVPECTNISVGYEHEHSRRESLNLNHILALRKTLLTLDTTALPVERDPTIRESYGSYGGYESEDWSGHYPDSNGPLSERALDIIKRNPEHAVELLRAYGLSDDDIIDEMIQLGADEWCQ